jgi:hypothetical protein
MSDGAKIFIGWMVFSIFVFALAIVGEWLMKGC